MTELAQMMINLTFLEVCKGIQGLCASLYHYYGKIYEDIPEASHLWKKTALEEENHQMQFGQALRLFNATELEVMKDSLKRAYSVQRKLQQVNDRIIAVQPDLMTAVTTAIEMEEDIANLHEHVAVNFKEESLQRLFKNLGEADCGHVDVLRCYRRMLSLQYSEVNG